MYQPSRDVCNISQWWNRKCTEAQRTTTLEIKAFYDNFSEYNFMEEKILWENCDVNCV